MKKIFILIFSGVFLIQGCEKKLDMYPHTQVAAKELTNDDIETLLNGLYNRIQNKPTNSSYVMFDIIGGNLMRGGASGTGEYNTMINDMMQPEAGLMATPWNAYYTSLYQINNMIEAALGMEESNRKDEILGIAYFFRGLTYYNLVVRYGGVPVFDKNSTEKKARNTEVEVWNFIEKDLLNAIENAPGFTNINYVSREAAMAIMARTKLAQGKMEEAAKYAEELITSGLFELDAFENTFRGKSSKEIIFCFANYYSESGANISPLFLTRNHQQGGSYQYQPTNEVMTMFDVNDNRKPISIDTYSGSNVINKYVSGENATDRIIISRIAELYLISAEAGKDTTRLNQLRRFRGLTAVSSETDKDFINAVMKERRLELLAEGFRWYDLVRLNMGQTSIGLSDKQLKFPIPARERLLNNLLEQNPGY